MKYIVIILALCLGGCASAQRRVAQNPVSAAQQAAKSHPVVLKLRSVDSENGSGVTRIGLDMQSIPSTSSRLDSARLFNGKAEFLATDVDGVDFGRYFQWEDNGCVYMELDFPRQKKIAKGARVVLYTVHGTYTLPVKK